MTEQQKANVRAILDKADEIAEKENNRSDCIKIQKEVERIRQMQEEKWNKFRDTPQEWT